MEAKGTATADSVLANLHPAYFAMVMATGIPRYFGSVALVAWMLTFAGLLRELATIGRGVEVSIHA